MVKLATQTNKSIFITQKELLLQHKRGVSYTKSSEIPYQYEHPITDHTGSGFINKNILLKKKKKTNLYTIINLSIPKIRWFSCYFVEKKPWSVVNKNWEFVITSLKKWNKCFNRHYSASIVNKKHFKEWVNQLFANIDKCTFCVDIVVFLSFVINKNGVHVDLEKIKVIQEWPIHKNVGDVPNFHGLASFYRRFIPNFSILASHLNELVKKDVSFCVGWKTTTCF